MWHIARDRSRWRRSPRAATSSTTSRCRSRRSPSSSPRPTPRSTHAFPGVRLVDFGHLGDGNLHYNVQAPPRRSPRAFVARFEHDDQRASSTTRSRRAAARSRPSTASARSSATSSSLRKSPVALDMMRGDQERARSRRRAESRARAAARRHQPRDEGAHRGLVGRRLRRDHEVAARRDDRCR